MNWLDIVYIVPEDEQDILFIHKNILRMGRWYEEESYVVGTGCIHSCKDCPKKDIKYWHPVPSIKLDQPERYPV